MCLLSICLHLGLTKIGELAHSEQGTEKGMHHQESFGQNVSFVGHVTEAFVTIKIGLCLPKELFKVLTLNRSPCCF